jgi:hypothetical protein
MQNYKDITSFLMYILGMVKQFFSNAVKIYLKTQKYNGRKFPLPPIRKVDLYFVTYLPFVAAASVV